VTGQELEVKRGVEVYRGEPFHCQSEGLAMKRSRLNGSTAQRLNGSTAQRLNGSTAQRLNGSM
jgi:hypothetical protein